MRDSKDPLTKKTAEHFITSFNLLRQKTEGTDQPFIEARTKYFSLK